MLQERLRESKSLVPSSKLERVGEAAAPERLYVLWYSSESLGDKAANQGAGKDRRAQKEAKEAAEPQNERKSKGMSPRRDEEGDSRRLGGRGGYKMAESRACEER